MDENGIRLEEIHSFADETNVKLYGFHDGELVYWSGRYYSAGCGNIFSGHVTTFYAENLETGEIREIENTEARALEDEYFGYYEKRTGVTCGSYTYFLHTEDVGGLMSSQTAYLLKRYNAAEDKFDVMQLWHEDDDSTPSEYSRCTFEFWFKATEQWYDFIILDF